MSEVACDMSLAVACASPVGAWRCDAPGLPAELLSDPALRALAAALNRLDASGPSGELLAFVDENLSLAVDGPAMAWPALGAAWGECGWDNVPLGIAFYLASLGAQGQWTYQVASHSSVVVYLGTFPLTLRGRVVFEAAGRRTSIVVDGWAYSFQFLGGQWVREDSLPWLVRSGTFNLAAHAMATGFDDVSFTGSLALASSGMEDIVSSLARALYAIERAYPAGAAWMARVLRGVVLVDTRDGSTTSGSSSSHPGLVYVSHPIDDHHLAAQLIHECAHQYLACFNGYARLVRPDCADTFYSPFKRANRPLYNVLLALHAAVNIRRLTARMLASGMRSGYVVEEDARLSEEIGQMYGDIKGSSGWTEAGREFLEALEAAMP